MEIKVYYQTFDKEGREILEELIITGVKHRERRVIIKVKHET